MIAQGANRCHISKTRRARDLSLSPQTILGFLSFVAKTLTWRSMLRCNRTSAKIHSPTSHQQFDRLIYTYHKPSASAIKSLGKTTWHKQKEEDSSHSNIHESEYILQKKTKSKMGMQKGSQIAPRAGPILRV